MRALVMATCMWALLSGAAVMALASDSATQTVTFAVTSINEFAVSGNPAPLTITTSAAGSDPTPAIDATTSYAITINGSNKKITCKLDREMPAETTLRINLAAPRGATSLGDVALDREDRDLVRGITRRAEGGRTITYTLSATAQAGAQPLSMRTVTFTVTDGA